MPAAGIDGCKNGWVIASEASEGHIALDVVPDFRSVLHRKCDPILVDIPIGLMDRGTRLADQEARRLLKRRACCVFTAPLRPMLSCADYSDARTLRLQIEGKSLTKQAWAIVRKIKEVDSILSPEVQSRIREGHPEVSFAHMNGGQALANSKHTATGRRDRFSLLAVPFPDVASLVRSHSRIAEDVIDACAMLWSAQRIHNKRAAALPGDSPLDSRGLKMQIWA
jgi:predicted RNase H-like nuclease